MVSIMAEVEVEEGWLMIWDVVMDLELRYTRGQTPEHDGVLSFDGWENRPGRNATST